MKRNLNSVASWIDGYFESLAKGNATGQSETLALKRSHFPDALYRYRSLERFALVLEELRDGYVYLSNPANFNDPYDSALSVSAERLQKRILEKVGPEYGFDSNIVSEHFASLTKEEKEQEQQSTEAMIIGLLSIFYGLSASPDLFSAFRDLVRVSCFSENLKSVLMWSHYANQHKGICIEYSRESMISNDRVLELLHPVRYSKDIFDFWVGEDKPMSPTALPVLAACHKSSEWEYEHEWRLVHPSKTQQKFVLEFFEIKPSKIIFGSRIAYPEKAAIKELAERKRIPLYCARPAEDRFEIKIDV